jgi:butyrate kinase
VKEMGKHGLRAMLFNERVFHPRSMPSFLPDPQFEDFMSDGQMLSGSRGGHTHTFFHAHFHSEKDFEINSFSVKIPAAACE